MTDLFCRQTRGIRHCDTLPQTSNASNRGRNRTCCCFCGDFELGGEAADCTGMDVAVEPLFHCILFLQTSSSRALLMTLRGATVTGSQQGQRQHQQRQQGDLWVSLMVDEQQYPHCSRLVPVTAIVESRLG
jgi:hypothetical protein